MSILANNKSAVRIVGTGTGLAATSHAAGTIAGGVFTFANFFALQNAMQYSNLQLLWQDLVNPGFNCYLFGDPLVGTYTDGAAFALNASDVPCGRLSITSDIPALGTGSHGQADFHNQILNTTSGSNTSLFMIPVVSAAWTPTAANSLTAIISAIQP